MCTVAKIFPARDTVSHKSTSSILKKLKTKLDEKKLDDGNPDSEEDKERKERREQKLEDKDQEIHHQSYLPDQGFPNSATRLVYRFPNQVPQYSVYKFET